MMNDENKKTTRQQRIKELQQRYRELLPSELEAVRTSLAGLAHHWQDPRQLEWLKFTIHRLAGSGATFGLNEVSHLAHQLEVQIKDWDSFAASPGRAAISRAENVAQLLQQAANDG